MGGVNFAKSVQERYDSCVNYVKSTQIGIWADSAEKKYPTAMATAKLAAALFVAFAVPVVAPRLFTFAAKIFLAGAMGYGFMHLFSDGKGSAVDLVLEKAARTVKKINKFVGTDKVGDPTVLAPFVIGAGCLMYMSGFCFTASFIAGAAYNMYPKEK